MPEQKRCCKCKQVKPLAEFCKSKACKDGYHTTCLECRRLEGRQRHTRVLAFKLDPGKPFGKQNPYNSSVCDYLYEEGIRPGTKYERRMDICLECELPKCLLDKAEYGTDEPHDIRERTVQCLHCKEIETLTYIDGQLQTRRYEDLAGKINHLRCCGECAEIRVNPPKAP